MNLPRRVLCAALLLCVVNCRSTPPEPDLPLDPATRARVVDAMLVHLEHDYVFPEVAQSMAREVRARRAEWDHTNSSSEFAQTMTTVLRELAHGDQHLEVTFSPQVLSPPAGDDAPAPEEALRMTKRTIRKNGGFERVARLKGNVGLLELSKFYRPAAVRPKFEAAMALLADTAALIIDLRDCDGGDPETVMLVASAFFDERTHLNDVYWRDEDRIEERWTEPATGPRYGGTRKLVLLVSRDTASACEDFAYALLNAKRAEVFGETTAGAAHGGMQRRLDDHFLLFVPTGRPINPVTHTDWEGVGVIPTRKVSAGSELDVAHIEILRDLIAHETDLDWKEKLEHMLRELD